MKGLLKFLLKLIIFLIVLVVLYVGGLKFKFVPKEWTPQQLFKQEYMQFKADLSKGVAENGTTSSISKSILNFLNDIENEYAANDEDASKQMHLEQADESNKHENTTTTQEPKSAIDKARDAVQQYEENLDEQKQVLDNL